MKRSTKDRDAAHRDAAVLTSFGPGAIVQSDEGEMPVEWLDTRHKLVTRDHGLQPILYINRLRMYRSDFRLVPDFAPVLVPSDAFGPGIPASPVRVSPNTPVLYRSWRAELHYASNEVLVPAKTLADPEIYDRPGDASFVYTQILMQKHELLLSERMWIGSLFVADLNKTGVLNTPDLAEKLGDAQMIAARPILTEAEARMLIDQDLGIAVDSAARDSAIEAS